jgi:hypothetical protein
VSRLGLLILFIPRFKLHVSKIYSFPPKSIKSVKTKRPFFFSTDFIPKKGDSCCIENLHFLGSVEVGSRSTSSLALEKKKNFNRPD